MSFTRSIERYAAFGAKNVVMGYEDEHGQMHSGVAQRLGNVNLKETTMDAKRVETKPEFSNVAAPKEHRTLSERLTTIKARGIIEAQVAEKRSIGEHAASIVAMDRKERAVTGERDAQRTQATSAFVQALPGMAQRRQRVAEQVALEAANRKQREQEQKALEQQRAVAAVKEQELVRERERDLAEEQRRKRENQQVRSR